MAHQMSQKTKSNYLKIVERYAKYKNMPPNQIVKLLERDGKSKDNIRVILCAMKSVSPDRDEEFHNEIVKICKELKTLKKPHIIAISDIATSIIARVLILQK